MLQDFKKKMQANCSWLDRNGDIGWGCTQFYGLFKFCSHSRFCI